MGHLQSITAHREAVRSDAKRCEAKLLRNAEEGKAPHSIGSEEESASQRSFASLIFGEAKEAKNTSR